MKREKRVIQKRLERDRKRNGNKTYERVRYIYRKELR